MGIEPTSSAWKAEVLPLNYTRSASQPHMRRSYTYTLLLLCLLDRQGTAAPAEQKTSTFSVSYAPPVGNLVEGVGFEPT